MGINLVTFYGSTVTPQDDALIYESALAGSGLIYGGTVTIKSANMLHVAAGHGALCGRKFTIEETDVPVILSSSGTLLGRIYIHMDLSDTGEPISFQVETGSALAPVIQQQDVNIIDGVYEINLATFDVDTASISNLVNVAPYIEADLDTEFSTTSKKALQNKVITKALGDPETIGGAASKAYSKGSLLLGKDGQLYEVTTAISQGETIINNGNVKTTGNVITQISNFANKSVSSFGTSVNLVNYTSSNPYTAPCDGYMITYCVAVQGRLATGYVINGPVITSNGYPQMGTNYNSLFVRKGMQLYGTKDSYTGDYQSAVTFKPINYSV